MNENELRARFEELAPWHVNGTLDPAQREWVDQYLREHPEARAELRWHESLMNKMRDNAPDVSPDIGWDRFIARARAERRAQSPGFFERVSEWLGFRFTPALATAAALVVVQAGVIGLLLVKQAEETGYGQYRAIGSAPVSGPVLQVTFKETASEREVRMALVGINGSLIGGPGQLGNYLVYVPATKIEQAAAKLQHDASVEAVIVLPQVPPKSE